MGQKKLSCLFRCPHFRVKTRGVPLYMYCNYAILNDHLHTLQLVYVMLYVHILTSGRMLLTVSVCMYSEGYCTWFMCVSVCVCVCVMPYFLDTVSLYVEMKVSMASVQHGADFYKRDFPYKCLSYGVICLSQKPPGLLQ